MPNNGPLTNPTAKQRFMLEGSAAIHGHREMIQSRAFERGADFALIEYNAMLAAQVRDGNTAMAAGLKLQGALEFLQTFRLLAETPAPLRTAPAQGLNPNA